MKITNQTIGKLILLLLWIEGQYIAWRWWLSECVAECDGFTPIYDLPRYIVDLGFIAGMVVLWSYVVIIIMLLTDGIKFSLTLPDPIKTARDAYREKRALVKELKELHSRMAFAKEEELDLLLEKERIIKEQICNEEKY